MFLLFDIGGTKTRVAVTHENSQKIEQLKIFPTHHDFEQAVADIASAAKEMLGNGDKLSLAAGGLAVPMDKDKTMAVFHSEKDAFKDWVGKPIKSLLEEKLQTKIFLENDAAMGALGEAIFGAGKDKRIVAFLTISTGVGGARIVDGMIDDNSMGFEPGWQIIDATGALCPEWGKAPIYLGIINGENAKERMQKDPDEINADTFWDQSANFLALGVHNSIMHWSPDAFVLGGSMMKKIQIEKVRSELKSIASPFQNLPVIKIALLGDQCGLYGALHYLNAMAK